MLVFTSYLSNIINLLKYSNIEAMHQRAKNLLKNSIISIKKLINIKKVFALSCAQIKNEKLGLFFINIAVLPALTKPLKNL